MSHVNRYNGEGYADPTTYEALTRIEREAKKTAYRPLVFISSPYAGDTGRNAERAHGYDVTLETDEKGEIVIEGLRIGEYKLSEVSNTASLPADKKATVQTARLR